MISWIGLKNRIHLKCTFISIIFLHFTIQLFICYFFYLSNGRARARTHRTRRLFWYHVAMFFYLYLLECSEKFVCAPNWLKKGTHSDLWEKCWISPWYIALNVLHIVVVVCFHSIAYLYYVASWFFFCFLVQWTSGAVRLTETNTF